jgi:hypothetical protein
MTFFGFIKAIILFYICKWFHKKHHKEKTISIVAGNLKLTQVVVYCLKCQCVLKTLDEEVAERSPELDDFDKDDSLPKHLN